MNAFLFILSVLALAVAFSRVYSRLGRAERRLSALESGLLELNSAGAPSGGDASVVGGDRESPSEPVVVPTPPPVTSPPLPSPSVPSPSIPSSGSPSPSPPSPRRRSISIDWERWVGVRGAAVLGGVVLALAGILFLKYSIEHDLIPPAVRVAIGVLVGVVSLVISEWLRKRDYETVSNSLAGASVVLFYASVWAAHALYQLIPALATWGFMVLVTVVCGLLSWRRHSLLVAVLGLIGGFVTPLLLSTGENRPFGLFAYILLLDVGLIVLARQRRWPVLAVLSLVFTGLYQLAWMFEAMRPDQMPIALGILALFAVVYALARWGEPRESKSGIWDRTQAGSVLVPYVFAFYLATRADLTGGLGGHLAPIAALLVLLSVLALGLSRALGAPILARTAAAADIGILTVWILGSRLGDSLAWEASAIAVAFALTFRLFRHLRTPGANQVSDRWPEFLATAGSLAVLAVGHLDSSASLWPWLAGWVALAALLVWSGNDDGTARSQLVAAVGLSIGFVLFLAAHAGSLHFPPIGLFSGLMLASAVGFQAVALMRQGGAAGRNAELSAATSAAVLLVGSILLVTRGFSAELFFGLTLGLGVLLAMSSLRLPSGKLLLATMATVALGHLWWQAEVFADRPGEALVGLAGSALAVLFFTGWPLLAGSTLAGRTLAGDRWALYASALAAPAWFLPLSELWERRFGLSAIGALPILLAVVSLGAAVAARRQWSAGDPQHKRSLVWFLAVALGLVSLAIPLQLEREWITIGWALAGFAFLALWRRLDHAGLKYCGLALLAATSVRLVGNSSVLHYHQRAAVPIVNWLMYTYLVPAAALLASARLLAPLEVSRRRDWEQRYYGGPHPAGAIACGLAAILVVFGWVNLTIFDFFSSGSQIQLSLDRHMARDLTLSLAWALFALGLLAIGMVRKSSGLRWISLCFLILTIAKAFLYDLGELEDLYQVASLAGLAVSLIAVSLAYQRFVFRPDRAPDGAATEAGRAAAANDPDKEQP